MADARFLEQLETVRKKYLDNGNKSFTGNPLELGVVDTGDNLPTWWSVSRDRKLYEMMLKSDHLSGLAYTALTKLANIPLQFLPRNRSITSHVDRANEFSMMVRGLSDLGEGLRMCMKRFILDYLVTDNGGFMEVLGAGPEDGPIVGMPWGLRHLSSLRCRRTGDPEYPVVYIDGSGKKRQRYKIYFSRVIYMAQMPMGITQKNGVGLGSVSRSHLLGEVLTGQLLYKLEKMGRRPNTKLFIGDGISAQEMIAAFLAAGSIADNLGLESYGLNVYIGGSGIGLKAEDLNTFDPFDEETGTLMAMYAIAYAWGLKIQDIWPVSGSKASDQISNMQSRGRLPVDFINDLQEQLEFKLCPPFIEPVFYEQDDEQEMMQANIADIRSRSIGRIAETEVLDNSSQRRIMFENGQISREEFVRQQLADDLLEDGAPIATLFHSDDKLIRKLVKLSEFDMPLVFEENEPEAIIQAIHVQMDACYKVAASNSEARKRKALMALAALEWLKGQYQHLIMQMSVEAEEARIEEEAEEMVEEQPSEEQQEEVPVAE